ncbi:Psilocybin synthase [Exophiala dermatitidis]
MPAPDNIYENDVDFTTLALQYPQFAKKLKPNGQLDFSDPESVRQLTKSLLHRDFDLTIDLPEDRLCPPVPNRFNYILFIQRLLDDTSPDWHEGYDPNRTVIGLDIGTGSSAIYPLLACRQRPAWRFLATEIDEKNRTYALQNITANDFQSRIKLVNTDPTGQTLLPVEEIVRMGIERIDIVMTNPPFYPSSSSLLESAHKKSRPPNSSCTGAPIEMITPGGEVAFVSRLIDESYSLSLSKARRGTLTSVPRLRIQWFSSMLGKLSSVSEIVEALKSRDCTNFAVTEFVQGSQAQKKAKTRRWCVAWSWMGFRPGVNVSRGVSGSSGVEKRLLPAPTEYDFEVEVAAADTDTDVGAVERKLNQEMAKLDSIKWRYLSERRVGMFLSPQGDVWSRKARRKKQQQQTQQAQSQTQVHQTTTTNKDKTRARGNPEDPEADQDEEMTNRGQVSNDQAEDEGKDHEDEEDEEPALVVRISVIPPIIPSTTSTASTSKNTKVHIHIRHLHGQEPVLFESFCGWLKRKMTTT